MLILSRYIHLNPINIKRIKIQRTSVKKQILNRYKWSSYCEVLNPDKRSKYFRCEKVLDLVGGDTGVGRIKYKEYIDEAIEKKVKSPFDEVKYQILLGSDNFIDFIKKKFLKGKNLKPFTPEIRGIEKLKSVKEISEGVAKYYKIDVNELFQMRSKHKEARQVFIEVCYVLWVWKKSLKNLGYELGGMTGSGIVRVHERLKEKIKKDKTLNNKINTIKMKLGCS